jgi:tetratricopeptide (TPR) repeat protein
MGIVEERLGNYQKALEYHEKSLEIKIKCVGPLDVIVAATYMNMGVVRMELGNFEKALEQYGRLLKSNFKASATSMWMWRAPFNNIGLVHQSLGKFEKALEFFEKDLEISLKSLCGNHVNVADTLFSMSIIYDNIGDETDQRGLS